ncbi:MAG: hypothetical protein M3O85_01555 [Acidobacteriota bacterium]|nr:hypothetical protein [Acidobacteriota bacterium]
MRLAKSSLTIAALGLLAVPGAAQTAAPSPAESARELVRRVVDRELAAEKKPRQYIYRLRREGPEGSGSTTRDIIDTRDGLVSRLIATNDRPATAEERAKDDRRLEHLLAHPEEQRKRKQRQEQDAEEVRKLLRALPGAFLYEFDGSEPGPHGELTRLKFRPDPKFDPPSRETIVYKGMEGMMVVEPRDLRLVRIESSLVENVTLGWGLLARLNRGGRITMEQSLLPNGEWQTTRMTLDFTGKAFLFKTIRIQQKQSITDFRPVPTSLSLAAGIELLKKQDGAVAEKK